MNLKKYNYSREAIILLVMHSLYTLGTALTSVFLNIFLWKLGNSVSINAAYNLIAFGTMVFACILGGRLTKKFGKVTVYRIGICLISLFFASILILKQNVIDYYHGIAVLHGIGLALYWMGHALITYDVTTEDNRMKYISISFVINTTLSIIGPSLAGNIIVNQNEMKGYYIIFMAALTLFFITALGSLWLNNKSKNEKFLLKYMGLLMKKNPNWFVVLIGWFIIGLLHGLMYFLTDILLFRSLGKEDYVGYMSMTLLIISVITSFIMSYNTKQNAQKNYIYTSSIGYAIISLLLIFWSNNIVII
ncbi:MFS transporter, partial [Paenibacillus sp. GCM10012307]